MRICLIIALTIVICGGCRNTETLVDENFRFSALDENQEFSLQGVPIEIRRLIVNFYAPDCPPCEKEIGALREFYGKFRADASVGFVAIGSSLKAVDQNPKAGKDPPLSAGEIRKDLADFRRKFRVGYPQYVAESPGLTAWRVTGFPETFIFIRKNNKLQLQRKIISEVTYDMLVREINGTGG